MSNCQLLSDISNTRLSQVSQLAIFHLTPPPGYWHMIQQFMDVSHPLPDVPIFEPFRPRDPLTAEVDERQGRDPHKWRNMTPETWRKDHYRTYQTQLQNAQFHHPCLLDAHIEGRGLPLPDEPQGTMLA